MRGKLARQIPVRGRTGMTVLHTSPNSAITRWLLEKIYDSIGAPNIRMAVGDGEPYPTDTDDAVATVRINGWRTLASLVLNPEIGFGEGYRDGRIDVPGDLAQFLETTIASMPESAPGWCARLSSRWLYWLQANTRRGSARNIHHHYDLSADFYKLVAGCEAGLHLRIFPRRQRHTRARADREDGPRLPQAPAAARRTCR